MKARTSRTQNGQMKAAGSAAVWLIPTMVMLVGLLLLAITGLEFLCQMKLQFAAQQGAQAALNGTEWLGAPRTPISGQPTVQEQVNLAVNTCLKQMGMSAMPNDVPITTQTESGVNVYTVTVSNSMIPSISGSILAKAFPQLSGTASATNGNQSPPALGWIYTNASGAPGLAAGGICVPAYSFGYGKDYAAPDYVVAGPYPTGVPQSNQIRFVSKLDGITTGF